MRAKDGDTKVWHGVVFHWSRSLQRWVTIPGRDEDGAGA